MNRKDIRLPEYDYSRAGAYFVTVCSQNREPLFWEKSGDGTPVGADIIRPQAGDGAPVGQGLCPCLRLSKNLVEFHREAVKESEICFCRRHVRRQKHFSGRKRASCPL